MSDGVVVTVTVVVLIAIAGVLVGALVRSMLAEGKPATLRGSWKAFGLSLAFCILFLVSWGAQAVAEWGTYRNDQREHGEPVVVSEYLVSFGQSTLENWQSEFLQLFSFVVFSTILIHKGSAESRDSDDEMQRMLRRIDRRLAALEDEHVSEETSPSS